MTKPSRLADANASGGAFVFHEREALARQGNLRTLPRVEHRGRDIVADGRVMRNLSSNDYLGLGGDMALRGEFLSGLTPETFMPTASSSRLLTGNHQEYERLEALLARLYRREAALVFSSGYHMNAGLLPAVSTAGTLILADKRVHASFIDGIRLAKGTFLRYRHNDGDHLEEILAAHAEKHERVIVVTESIFSMDGDEADLRRLVALKRRYPSLLLYVDEAHAVGVRGDGGLGCAEAADCLDDIDFLAGTFGKALASVGGFVVCSTAVRDCLVNRMRTLIFTTALPPVNLAWTRFVLERLAGFGDRRDRLATLSGRLRRTLDQRGLACPSSSHIVPVVVGASTAAMAAARRFQENGYYLLPVRPPTVPEGGARLRISLTADLTDADVAGVEALL